MRFLKESLLICKIGKSLSHPFAVAVNHLSYNYPCCRTSSLNSFSLFIWQSYYKFTLVASSSANLTSYDCRLLLALYHILQL